MYVCKKYTFGILIFCKCLYYCLLWLFFRYAKTYALLFLMICKVCFVRTKTLGKHLYQCLFVGGLASIRLAGSCMPGY